MTQIKKYTKKDGSTAYMFNAYVGRNPKTGKSVEVAAKAVPHFKPGKALRDAVNESAQ